MKYYSLILLMIVSGTGLWLFPAATYAADSDFRSYYIDEPVFQGQAYIVESGKPDKPLIILVHGLGDWAAETWRQFIPDLSKDFHVVCFDLPGFGRSSKANKLYSPDNYVRFINFISQRYHNRSFILVGHSMGANIALRYAATYPEKVDRLMLLDAAGILHRLAYAQFLQHYGIKILPEFYKGQRSDLESISDLLLGPLAENAGLLEIGEQLMLEQPALRENLLGGEPNAIAAYAMIMTDYSRILETIKTPTLIVWGGRDAVTPMRTAKVLATKLPNAGLIVFESAGHSPMIEEPARFSTVLNKFTKSDKSSLKFMLDQHRYRKPEPTITSNKYIDCLQASVSSVSGGFNEIIIRNCRDLVLRKFVASKVRIFNSKIQLENCHLKGTGKTLEVINSDVLITSCRIEGAPAIDIIDSNLDIAGSELVSRASVLINSSRKRHTAETSPLTGKLLFSVSKISSGHLKKYLHSPLILQAGDSL